MNSQATCGGTSVGHGHDEDRVVRARRRRARAPPPPASDDRGRGPSTARRRSGRTSPCAGASRARPGRGPTASMHAWLMSAYASMPVVSTTSFFSRRWTTITSDPSSSCRPATFWRITLPWWTTNLRFEVRDADARVALTRRRLADVAPPSPEAEVAAFDGVEQHRAVDRLGGHEGERGVALELGQPEVRPKRRDDRADEVGEDVLRVVELDVGEVARVAGDVGDQEAGLLGGWGHPATIRPALARSGPQLTCAEAERDLASRYRS